MTIGKATKATPPGQASIHVSLTSSEISAREAEEKAFLAESVERHKTVYREKRVAEGITFSSHTIATDDLSQQRISSARVKAEADSNFTTYWRTAQGWLQLSNSDIKSMSDAVLAHVQKCFEAHRVLNGNTYADKAAVETAFDTAYDNA